MFVVGGGGGGENWMAMMLGAMLLLKGESLERDEEDEEGTMIDAVGVDAAAAAVEEWTGWWRSRWTSGSQAAQLAWIKERE